MVSVLALNKLELKDMINAEMVENPVLEELEESVPLLDEVGKKEEDRERAAAASNEENPISASKIKIPSKRSISVRSSRIISIPAIAPTARWRTSSARRSKIFSPNHRISRITWLGSWCAQPPPRSAGGARPHYRQFERRRIPHCQRRRTARCRPAAAPEADAAAAKSIVSEAQALGLAEVAGLGRG